MNGLHTPVRVAYKVAIGTPDVVQSLPVRDVAEPLPPLVFERDGNLWRSDGIAQPPRQLTQFNADEQVRYPSVSPDGQRIAFVTTLRGAVPTTSTLYLMNRDGSGLRAVWAEPRCWMGQSAWLPDGQAVLISTNYPATQTAWGPSDYQIARADLATGAHQPILDNADSPAISPDGSTLLYVWMSADRAQLELRAAAVDGSNARTLLNGAAFSHLFAPRFSPDGTRIVFPVQKGRPPTRRATPPRALSRHHQNRTPR